MTSLNNLIQRIQSQTETCSVDDVSKVDCGDFPGVDQFSCESRNCCWQPVLREEKQGVPWCYYKTSCDINNFNWAAPSPGYDVVWEQYLLAEYQINLDYLGTGAVIAAYDFEMRYDYHWMRDAALSVKAYLEIKDNDLNAVRTVGDNYVNWVAKVQQAENVNNCDVRVEPKFYIPSGDVFVEPWCRPQTDGPGLRAMALSKYGDLLLNAGEVTEAERIWSLVTFDLAWVESNWASDGCDLWEEVTSTDFYWNRAGYVYSLHAAADFGERLNYTAEAANYRSLASKMLDTFILHVVLMYFFRPIR